MKELLLSETLMALIDGATPCPDSLCIDEIDIRLPLLVHMRHGFEGVEIVAHPPYSAFRSGVEPTAHMAHIRIENTRFLESESVSVLVAPSGLAE